ncbi:MAG: AAA family ATPase, partial [Bacillota bacterium]|nr:AAA family ATPase [Bacillota bacterium]
MEIKLPSINGENKYVKDKNSIVLIGANGSGKTRMSIWIDNNNPKIKIHRISAQKSLNMPSNVKPSEMKTAEENFYNGYSGGFKEPDKFTTNSYRWGGKPETHLLNDFDKLMELLMTEQYQKVIEYREEHKAGNKKFTNETKLEK